MAFDPTAYGPEVAALLAEERAMPLVHGSGAGQSTRQAIERAALPEPARAGLYLYFGFWDEAHEVAQSIENQEGSYWHAIVHRQEPDAGNASYWFGQVGSHPIFPALAEQAAAIEPEFAGRWSPAAFIDYCGRARSQAGSEIERRALAIQRVEWQLLFDHSFNSAMHG